MTHGYRDSRMTGKAWLCSLGVWCLLAAAGAASPVRAEAPVADDNVTETGLLPTAKGGFLGLKTAIGIGLGRHPLLKKAKQTAQAHDAVAEQTKSKFYPQVDGYAIQTGGTIRPLSAFNIAGAQNKPTSYVTSAGLRADQLIYDFGQTAHRLLASRARQEAAAKDVLTNKALVILRVQQVYLQCLRQKRLVGIAEAIVRELGLLRDQVTVLYKRHLKSKLDLNLIALEVSNAKVQLVQANNELLAAYAALNNAMGVQGLQEYTLENVSVGAPADPLPALTEHALLDRPELLGTLDRIRQSEERTQADKRLSFPTMSAMGMYGVIHFSDAPTNQFAGAHPGFTKQWWGAGFQLSIPLFTGFLIEHRVAESKAKQHKARQEKRDLSNRIRAEVSEAYFTLHTANAQVAVEAKEVEASRSALLLAKERYRYGLASIVDVTSAATALMAAAVRHSEAQYARDVSGVALTFATGRGYKEYGDG